MDQKKGREDSKHRLTMTYLYTLTIDQFFFHESCHKIDVCFAFTSGLKGLAKNIPPVGWQLIAVDVTLRT